MPTQYLGIDEELSEEEALDGKQPMTVRKGEIDVF